MNQTTSSDWFEELRYGFGELLSPPLQYINHWFASWPALFRTLFSILVALSVLNIVMSHLIAVLKNKSEWKQKPVSTLMFSYFCGSGQYQRKKIYQEAYRTVLDKTWSRISVANLALRLGNFVHQAKVILCVCSLLYLPLVICGFVEMMLRVILGTAWLLMASIVHSAVLFVLQITSYLLIPIWKLADKFARVKQHCPHCYNTFNLPWIKCPSCGVVHRELVPGCCGILVARCNCGRFLPSSVYTGRSNLEAVCPRCNGELAAANAKQFSVQLIGGNTSGKTAFLAAFQHLYIGANIETAKQSIHGAPKSAFEEFEKMFLRGVTTPSSADVAVAYNFIHRVNLSAKHNLVIYDVPDEVILSGDYERNPLNFGYSNGVIIVIDPLSMPLVREKCLKSGDTKVLDGYSKDDIGTVIVEFIHQFSEIVGRSARKTINIPVAVVISKCDVKAVKREVGLPKIKSIFDSDPSKYQNDIAYARNEICHSYLVDIGLTNAVNNLESVFSNVNYFPSSAIGHLSEENKPFEPFGVIEPMSWIAKERKASIYSTLRDAQAFIESTDC